MAEQTPLCTPLCLLPVLRSKLTVRHVKTIHSTSAKSNVTGPDQTVAQQVAITDGQPLGVIPHQVNFACLSSFKRILINNFKEA
jgi:hypothetical protein